MRTWTAKDDKALIEAYRKGVSRVDIGDSIGWSRRAALRHLHQLFETGKLDPSRPKKHKQVTKCTGDCDNCPFPDCYATEARAAQVQNYQEKHRYERLPDCDKRVIDRRKTEKQKEHHRRWRENRGLE